jgi:AmiR/NasT family two-component response regulator
MAGHLKKALTSRSVIDQAVGVIIARTGHDAEHAFQLLRAQSQDTNVKLRDLAAQIVKRAATRVR